MTPPRPWLAPLTVIIVGILGLGLTFYLRAGLSADKAGLPSPPPTVRPLFSEPMPEFAFEDQDGQKRKLSEFAGKATFLLFMFTECPNPCPILTSNFATFQREIAADGAQGIALLSVSVNPNRDVPSVLKAYGESYGANFATWTFARGKEADIRGLVKALKGDDSLPLVMHSPRCYLVGPDGRFRRVYDVRESAERLDMLEDAKTLLAGGTLQ